MRLYVESQKTNVVAYTMPNFGHYCSAGYRTQGIQISYEPQDEKVITHLKSKGISFNLVDFSLYDSFDTRLKAKLSGVRRTPTLVLNNGTKIEGTDKILEYLNGTHPL